MSFYPSAPEVPRRHPVGTAGKVVVKSKGVGKSTSVPDLKLGLEPGVVRGAQEQGQGRSRHNGVHVPPPTPPPPRPARSEKRSTSAGPRPGTRPAALSGRSLSRDVAAGSTTPIRETKRLKKSNSNSNSNNSKSTSKSDAENSAGRGSLSKNSRSSKSSKQVRIDLDFPHPPTSFRVSTRTTSTGTGTGTSKLSRYKSSFSNFSSRTFSTTSRSTKASESIMSLLNPAAASSTPNLSSTTTSSTLNSGPNPISLSHLEEQLFAFCKIPLGDFETCMAWFARHPPPTVDYSLLREKMLWQTYKTFERLLKRDFEERHTRLVREFAEQCVRSLCLLDYASDCGWERAREYVRHLVLTPELARMNYLSRMMTLPPQERLEFITRPVPDQLHKLKFFCLLYDHLYEKIEQEARHRMEKTLLDKFHTKLETVQARLSKGIGGGSGGAGAGATSPTEIRASTDVGRAL